MEIVGNSLECIGMGDNFKQNTNSAGTKITLNKLHLMKLRSFCETKDDVNQTERQSTEWGKIFFLPTLYPVEVQYSKYLKNSGN